MDKLDGETRKRVYAAIVEVIAASGIDPNTIDINGALDRGDDEIPLGNGFKILVAKFVGSMKAGWGPYTTAMDIIGKNIGNLLDDMSAAFAKATTIPEPEDREIYAHDEMHRVIDKLETLIHLTKFNMPCYRDEMVVVHKGTKH